MGLARLDDTLHTYAEYLTWTEDMRYELIDGVAYLMAPPAPTLDHQDFAGEIYVQLRWALDGKPCQVFIAHGEFGKPDVCALSGETPVGVLPGVAIAWDALVNRIPQPDW